MARATFSAGAPRGAFPATSIQTLPSVPRRSTQACLNWNPSVQRSTPGLRDPNGVLRWTSRRATPAAPRCAQSPGDGEGDGQPLETVLKLYTAMKDGNAQKVSDLFGWTLSPRAGEGDRRPLDTVLKLYTDVKDGKVPSLGPDLEAKKRVLQLFSSLSGIMGNNVEFVIKPTKHEGTAVGVAWRFDWKKTHKPRGGGSSFNTVHYYQGKMYLRNVEKLVEPIVRSGFLGRKLVENLRSTLDQITAFKENGRAGFMLSFVLLLLMAFSFLVIKKFPH